MALLKTFKVVSVLPGTLAADAIYAVRTGVGVALYVTDTTGAVAYALNNSGNVAASATLNVTPVANGYAEVVLPYAGLTAAAKVIAAFSPSLDEENDAEEISDAQLRLTAVPEAGQIRFVFISANGCPFVGAFKVHYQVTA